MIYTNLFILTLFLFGCVNTISEKDIYKIIINNMEVKKILEHQPDILTNWSAELVDRGNLTIIKNCEGLISKKIYRVFLKFEKDLSIGGSFYPTMYIDSTSGKECFNPENKLQPNACRFLKNEKKIVCLDNKATDTSIELVLQSNETINNVKLKSNFCKDEVMTDLQSKKLTIIKFVDCNIYMNHVTSVRDNIKFEYQNITGGVESLDGYFLARIE